MSRMNEQSQQEDERDNLSGMDDYEAWIASQEEDYKKLQRIAESVHPVDVT